MTEGSTIIEERNGRLQPIFNVPGVVKGLVAVLVIVHLTRSLAGEDIYIYSEAVFSLVPAKITGGFRESLPGEVVWNFLSYAFIHGSWAHLLFNCLWTVVFGSVVARRLGAIRFLVLSGIAAIVGAAAMLVIYWGEVVPIMGSSAAVFGQIAAVVPLLHGLGGGSNPSTQSDLSKIPALSFGRLFRDSRALMFVAVLLAITLVTGITDVAFVEEGANIAWQAHIGGFIAGLIAFYGLDQGPVI